ncbi:unnamed protein product [Clonostachys rosea]|uniref:Nucleoside phosphorylase domain-containing protein n=1 Tax=Bionectria ochroleuca TaxID=29856 RepID=A0ABY6UNM6_BIOOC|nr:unnamed protein product [Clonostachys rosea]
MDPPSLPNRMYTVGWICALAVEIAAATAMLDEVHQGPRELHPNDHNSYTLGRINNHNVVIACLPAGNYGIAPAASTAQQMLTSFTGIKFGLMVGIGGGIPQEGHDIQLGDIVVSQPKGQLGGVIQYDRGRELGLRFERTGWLNSPPEVLLTALNTLKASRWTNRNRLQELLASLAAKNPSFSRPDAISRHEGITGQSHRENYNPNVHYGLIASGNQVIKDAATRDRLRQELGNVLCFEMEAAGLMNNFPCLVIRGISDFADYHKNDIWQPYAAATAAAFAKNLLFNVHAHQVEDASYAANTTDSLVPTLPFSGVSDGKEFVAEATVGTCTWVFEDHEYKEWKQQHKGLLWITGKPGSGKSTLIKHVLMVESEGRSNESHNTIVLSFFFHNNESGLQATPLDFYRSLLHQLIVRYRDQLWNQLVGVVQNFQKSSGRSFSDTEGGDWHVNELERLLQSCIKRVLETHAIEIMVDALDECSEDGVVSLEAFFKNIRSQPASNPSRLGICITCRHFPLVRWQEGSEISVELRNEADIRTYARSNLEPFEDEKDAKALEDEIVERSTGIFLWAKLILPNIVLQQRKGLNPDQLLQSVRETPTRLTDIFEDVIQKLAAESHEKVWSLRLFQWLCFARKPLSVAELLWAMNVSVNSQCSSLKQCLRLPDSIRSEKQMTKRLRSLSGGLAELHEHRGTQVIQLIHQSAKDYLINRGFRSLDLVLDSEVVLRGQAHISLSQACIRYLAMDEIVRSDGNMPWQEFPFLDYAITSWTIHAEKAEGMHMSQEYILSSFSWPSEHIVGSWVRVSTKAHKNWPVPCTTLLHATARHGIASAAVAQTWGASLLYKLLLYLAMENWIMIVPVTMLFRQLLQLCAIDSHNADRKDDRGRTALSLAAERGHRRIVQILLLRPDVDVNATDKEGRTPLSWVAGAGHEEVMEMLLAHSGIDINLSDNSQRTPLMWATAKSNISVVLRLIQETADVTSSDHDGTTALHLAIEGGNERLAKILLDHGASLEAKDTNGRTALHAAALYGNTLMLQLLLSRGADITAIDNNGDTILHRVAGNKDPRVARLMIEKESDITAAGSLVLKSCIDLNFATDSNGRTALHRAAGNGRRALVEVLLQNKALINAEDHQKLTPLLVAMENRETAMVNYLVDKGADMAAIVRKSNTQDSPSRSQFSSDTDKAALESASEAGDEALARQLLKQDAPVTMGALSAAAKNGHEAIVRLLLEKRPYIAQTVPSVPRLRSDDNRALHDAARNGHEAVARLLLANGADVNADRFNTPLQYMLEGLSKETDKAAEAESMLKLLLESGANVESSYWKAIDSVARYGSKAMVQLLLDYGAEPTGRTLEVAAQGVNEPVVQLLLERDVEITSQALTNAVWSEHESTVRLLIERGAIPVQNTLHFAIVWGHEAVVRLLLEKGDVIDLDALTSVSGRTTEGIVRLLLDRGAKATSKALESAAAHGNEAIVRVLIDEGAVATSEALGNAVTNGHDATFWLLLEKGAIITPDTLVKAISKRNMAIVHLILGLKVEVTPEAIEGAAVHGNRDLVKLLLDKGGSITQNVLTRAINKGALDLVQLLLEKGAIISPEAVTQAIESEDKAIIMLLLSQGTSPNSSALEQAVKKGNDALIHLLLRRGVSVTSEALYNAIVFTNTALVRLLLDQVPKINDLKRSRGTALHRAVWMNDMSTSRLLLERGINVNVIDHYDATALHIATRYGRRELVSLLLQFGANVNQDHRFEGLPLWLAVVNGNDSIVQLLLEHGADANKRAYWGKSITALKLAIESDNLRTVGLLLQHGSEMVEQGGGTEMLDLAITNGNKAIIQLIKEHTGDVTAGEDE